MEDPTITKELDNEDKALKSLLDTFGSAFSLEEIASAFCKAGRDATLVGDILCGMQTGPSADATHESKGLINGEISSETPNYNNYDKSHDANRSSSQASKLKRNPTSVGTNSSFSGKEYVWRVVGSNRSPNATKPVKVEMRSVAPVSHASGKNCVWRIAGSNGALNGTELLKLEANDFSVPVNTSEEPLLSRDANLSSSDRSSSASDVSSNDDIENFLFEMLGHGSQLERSAIREVIRMEDPTITKELDNEDKALKSLLDTFGSAFSLEEIASAFCKAGRDATLVGDILCGMQTGPSADATHESKGLINGEISSETPNYNNYDKSHDANRSSSQASKLKRNPTSVGTNSSFSGKEYVWRVVGSNRSPNATKPVKVEMRSVAPVSHASGKNCVWRIAGSNGALNGTELLKLEANDFSVPVNTSEEPLLSRDANLSSSDRSSSASDVSSNDDIENFLFEMLGHGSQLERSAIREVLGHCGYDMKKSMETLLALMAENIDKRNQCEEINLQTNSKGLSFENQVQKQSNESRTMRTNLIPSRISSDSCEQADLIVSAPVLKNATRSWATREIVTEPLNDVAEDCEVKATSLHFNNVKDDAKEGSYYILRKAVKEHRETMKQYYEAATEAFAKGDRGRATLLLEKGQFFYNKAHEADEESASKIFETSDGSGDGEMREEMSLDLQDHDAKEAIRLVKIHLRTLSGIPMVRDLKIIIGTGDQDAEKRKRLISKLLQREAIRWIEDETSSAILIRLDEINPKSLSFGRK